MCLTSILFRRYPRRGIVLAASLALRGDSVTGVLSDYLIQGLESNAKTVFRPLDLSLNPGATGLSVYFV